MSGHKYNPASSRTPQQQKAAHEDALARQRNALIADRSARRAALGRHLRTVTAKLMAATKARLGIK